MRLGAHRKVTVMENRKYIGLKAALDEMPTLQMEGGLYIEISYNLDTDEVYAAPYEDIFMESHTEFANPRIIRVGNFVHRVPAEKLKERIDEAVARYLKHTT